MTDPRSALPARVPTSRRARWRAIAAVTAIGTAFVLASCARGPVVDSLPPVPSTLVLRSTVPPRVTIDYSTQTIPALPANPSPTTTTIDFVPGAATLTGVVVGPDGPVAGATVRVERLAGTGSATRDLVTDATGRYALANVALGRVRVRAWRSPDLSKISEDVLYVAGTVEHPLKMERFARSDVQWGMTPSPPLLGKRVNVVVQITTRQVSDQGVVGVQPLSGVGVSLYQQGALQVLSAGEKLTDDRGRALFTLECVELGPSDVVARLAIGGEARLGLPACIPLPPPPPPETPIDTAVASTLSPAVPVDPPSSPPVTSVDVPENTVVDTIPASPPATANPAPPPAPVVPAPTVPIPLTVPTPGPVPAAAATVSPVPSVPSTLGS